MWSVAGHAGVLDEASAHLGKHCNFVKVLGSYPNTE
jgi:prephenate dehydratase